MVALGSLCGALPVRAVAQGAQQTQSPLRFSLAALPGVPEAVLSALGVVLKQSHHVLVFDAAPLEAQLQEQGILAQAWSAGDVEVVPGAAIASVMQAQRLESVLWVWVEGEWLVGRVIGPDGGVHEHRALWQGEDDAREFLRAIFALVAPSVVAARAARGEASLNSDASPAEAVVTPAPAVTVREDAPAPSPVDDALPPGMKPLSVQLSYVTGLQSLAFTDTVAQGLDREVSAGVGGVGLILSGWSRRRVGLHFGGSIELSYTTALNRGERDDQLSALEIYTPLGVALPLGQAQLVTLRWELGPMWMNHNFKQEQDRLPQPIDRFGLMTMLKVGFGGVRWPVFPQLYLGYMRLLNGSYQIWEPIDSGYGVRYGARLRAPLGESFALSLDAFGAHEQMSTEPRPLEDMLRGVGSLSMGGFRVALGVEASF